MRRFRNKETGVVFVADENTQPPASFFTEQAPDLFERVEDDKPSKRSKKNKSDKE